MNYRSILIFLGLAILGAFTGIGLKAQNRPNIVVVYLDDLGYGDLSCYGATAVETPNVDKLAEGGMKFTDAHCSAAMCTPSRFSLLTGRYAFRNNAAILPGDAPMLITEDMPTLPGMLQKYGYKTAVVGKWHLGLGDGNVDWNGKITPGPLEIGFDYSYLIPATGDRVPCVLVENHHVVGLDPEDPIEVSYKEKVGADPTGLENPDLLRYQADKQHAKTIVNGVSRIGYMSGGNAARWNDETVPHQMLHKARDFMNQNQDRPFFLYFAFHDIHVPRLPDYRFQGATDMGVRGDAIVQMDWVTGQLMKHLEELGIADNTMIVFSSDNGPVLNDGYEDESVEKLGNHKPAGPFRGGKYSAFEGGTRVPTIVYWPAKIKPGESDALWGHMDLYASIAEIVGHELSDNEAPDSFNVLDAITGASDEGREYLLEEAYTFSLRKGDFKYIQPVEEIKNSWIENSKGIESGLSVAPQFYDLSKDIGETNNIARQNKGLVKKMEKELKRILEGQKSR
ncbi:sulfatase family protein [Marinilabilia rubra]|uniref:Arylsulfatase n=1 Tax=Marinilabilia rubra TaxID=2162893 RepID=A0A2U2B765_9BACT|nr:arylsulfatase [Marinilabilia rubra]PWD98921.1 arylsulfatase [Marinilabilia rubra]